jgi:DNA-binding NarL/FixJ family response regulator
VLMKDGTSRGDADPTRVEPAPADAATGSPERLRILLLASDAGDAQRTMGQLCACDDQVDGQVVTRLTQVSADHLAGFDCAVVEFGLSDASGPELLERLAELADDLPIVVLAGQADDDTAAALNHGAQECLVKQSADGQLIDRAVHCAVIRKRLRSAVDERLSRDLALHDRVIQQLFAIGVAMQTTELRSAQPEVAMRIADHLDGLHTVVQEMRAALQDVAAGTRAGRQGTGSGGPAPAQSDHR